MALQGGVRPEAIRARDLAWLWIDHTVGDGDGPRCRNLDTQPIQGRASIVILVPAFRPESPNIGYAPLVNRTKRWATESLIEGWFPLTSGERTGCEVVRNSIARPKLTHRLPRSKDQAKTGAAPDAGRHVPGAQRDGGVCLDRLPHRRNHDIMSVFPARSGVGAVLSRHACRTLP